MEKVINSVPQGLIMGSLLLLIYINDLPKITDNGAKVVLFAAFKANFLSLKFNEMYYLEFRTKNYIDTTLDINCFNKFINNVPYTHFLGLVIDGILNWDNHNDQSPDSTLHTAQ